MQIPVLTYHSVNILGNDYGDNDHVALEHDLRLLAALGFQVVPLADVVAAVLDGRPPAARVVAITFDDGAVFDYEDFDHPTCGFQKSFHRVLREFREQVGHAAQARLHASAFVIVSPDAREAMDRIDFGARDWWHDRWWAPATQDGLLAIENHSWDHNHPTVPRTAQKDNHKGTFVNIDTQAECDAEIRQAADYLRITTGRTSHYLAYPWGESSRYLREEYLPRFADELGIEAAFGTQGDYLTPASPRWNLPRFVCGSDWKSPEALEAILRGAG